jgi:hypothetical protein
MEYFSPYLEKTMKRCCTCKVEKEFSKFGKHRQWPDGFRPQCKECRNVKLRTGKPNEGRIKKGNIPWNKGIYTTGAKKSRRHDNWSKKVRERDGNKCTRCSATENLHAHHVIPWKDNIELRFDINNGLTLCGSCHSTIEPKLPKNPIAWNKGKKGMHFSPRTEIKKGQRISIKTEFKKGNIPWNKGIKK